MVDEIKEVTSKLTLKSLGAIAGIVFAVLSGIGGGFVYIDGKYTHQDIYKIHVEQNKEDVTELENKTAQLFVATQEASNQELNKIRQEIKAASALPLIVRRDVLTLRRPRLSDDEKGELQIILNKLDDLNIQ